MIIFVHYLFNQNGGSYEILNSEMNILNCEVEQW